MIAEGAVLALIGLGIVFLFLLLLVAVMHAIAFVARTLPSTDETESGTEAEIAAAVAAVRAYIRSHGSGRSP